ncbi:glycosyl hydrolase family 28-related protein [Sphingomonas sp. BK036]|uniref:glycosyl hydrolase family 28-related protein n=1 Tax=Sphingomonas sp. BK036 TaxID=2512122 RepID=UPI001A90EE1A|nr:glycosyl hydrolase family 28-related protein [Sphingomonas sp. BK036]
MVGSTARADDMLPVSHAGAAGRASVTPEQYGAKGDGIADDAPAIQRAIDSVAARANGGVVQLQPLTAYRCRSTITLDASRVSLWGQALLDFTGFDGRCLRITASSVARSGAANNYGSKGMISGAIHLRGGGSGTKSIGLDFDTDAVATSAQLHVENMAISRCGTGIRFGNRAYNSIFIHCEVFECVRCIDWPFLEDNGERNSFFGCSLYNSDVAVRMAQPSGSLQLIGCSIDYTRQLYTVTAGVVTATDCHHESKLWASPVIACSGNGALVRLNGGWLLNTGKPIAGKYVIDVGADADVALVGMVIHQVDVEHTDPTRPSVWATGAGRFSMEHSTGFDLGTMPMRLHESQTMLADPNFTAPDWQDPIWRIADTALPIRSRIGQDGDNLRLTRQPGVMVATKAYGTTAAAAFVLIAVPVRKGDQVLAGFRVRRDVRHLGTDGTVLAISRWARIDGHDANRVPVMTRVQDIGTLPVTPPTDRFVAIAPLASRTYRTAPAWATHFILTIDLVQAHQASFLFCGLWADTI